MQALTLEDLAQEAPAFDALVLGNQDLDQFCSSSDWILPAAKALMPPREPFVRRGEAGYVALMRSAHPAGFSCLEPLEAMWGLACPLVGPEPLRLARDFVDVCAQEAQGDVLILCGLVAGSPLFNALMWALVPTYELRLGPTTKRYCANLRGGLTAFLERRSANLRGSLKYARKRAAAAGIAFVDYGPASVDDSDAIYRRILAVERRSWKGIAGTGIVTGPMHGFYRLMLRRLIAKGSLRLMFALHDGRDVAYVLGAVLGDTYRGLQASFDDEYARYSLGGLAHYHQIAALCDEGVAAYDLGTDVEYKRRWGEDGLETVSLVAVPA